MVTIPDELFQSLYDVINQQQLIIASIAEKIQNMEGMGGGSASIEDYASGKVYKRNALVVDVNTETVYRVIDEYTSVNVETDCMNGHLKLVGFESQSVAFDHNPTQNELNALPDDTVVTLYSTTDPPYVPESFE